MRAGQPQTVHMAFPPPAQASAYAASSPAQPNAAWSNRDGPPPPFFPAPSMPSTPWAGPALPYGNVSIPTPSTAPAPFQPPPGGESNPYDLNDWEPRRRKAVLIGINYILTPRLRLKG
jgi:hypothetical protein